MQTFNHNNNLNNPDYFQPFFIGLLEGDGSISLGRRGTISHPVFRIDLTYNIENYSMLELLSKSIGGKIYYINNKRGNDQIAWKAVSQKDVKNILNILERYPLLTSRKICQLEHLKQCMIDRSWNLHLQTRDSKYLNQQKLIKHYNQSFEIPEYFGPWLSGFVEAEGCFRFTTNYVSLEISQNHDWYILNAIKQYLNSHHKIGIDRRSSPNHYRIAITGRPTVQSVIKHFEMNPLLGSKKISYETFCSKFYKNK